MSARVRDMLPISARRSSEFATPRLVVEELTKTFKGRAAIADVSLSLVEHEFTAVLGPSGAGKTTLFRCIAGLLEPDRGTVRLDADDIARLTGRDRRRVAFIFQQFNLVSRLTALENVLAGRLGYVPAWRGLLRRFERSDRLLALECLDRVGLLGHAMQRSDTLSGGQQQRVAVARALAQQPRLIVADEPVASLDPNSADSVMTLLRRIARSEGVAIICSLHQPHFARSYADRIIGLSRGRVMFAVPADQFDQAACAQLYATPETPSANAIDFVDENGSARAYPPSHRSRYGDRPKPKAPPKAVADSGTIVDNTGAMGKKSAGKAGCNPDSPEKM